MSKPASAYSNRQYQNIVLEEILVKLNNLQKCDFVERQNEVDRDNETLEEILFRLSMLENQTIQNEIKNERRLASCEATLKAMDVKSSKRVNNQTKVGFKFSYNPRSFKLPKSNSQLD